MEEEGGGVGDFSDRRATLVRRAVDAWKKQLIDLGGRNNLLYYRDLKVGTLDFADYNRRAFGALVEGKAVPLSRLFPDEEAHTDAVRRARAIHKKALEHFEERGIETLFLGYGMATWSPGGVVRAAPRAPVLLRPAHLIPRGAAQDEFEVVLTGEMELSPTLLHVLATEFRCTPDQSMLELDGLIDTPWELEEAIEWLKREASAVPGFAIESQAVVGTFSYMKLPMVRDLEENVELLESHDLVAAVAGDQGAREALREQHAEVTVALDEPDHTPPADEFLVVDADASQNWAINAAIRGQDLIVRGPPGTGKSQTIANLIASAVARGQRVLFVAEKRAAIDAVVKRLAKVGLADIVFDLHGGVAGRRHLAQALARSLDATAAIALTDRSGELAKLEKRRNELNGHADAFHRIREPFGVSVYDAEVDIIGTPDAARTPVRFSGDALAALDGETVDHAGEELHDFASLGGFSLKDSGSPWARATMTSSEEAGEALAATRELRDHTLPNAARGIEEAAKEVGVRPGETLENWHATIALWRGIASTLQTFRPEIYDQPLEDLCAELEPANRGGFARARARVTSGTYRSARKRVVGLIGEQRKKRKVDLYTSAGEALAQAKAWASIVEDAAAPRPPGDLERVAGLCEQLERELEDLERLLSTDALRSLRQTELDGLLGRLMGDQATLTKLPELYRLEQELRRLGFGQLLGELDRRGLSPELCRASLRHAWLESILEQIRLEDSRIGAFDGEHHTRTAEEFGRLDDTHIQRTADRVRRLWAERVVAARGEFRDEDALVRKEAGKKRKLMPFRELFSSSENLLLALKPCWVMSPLVVSQVLPPERLFDLVVFDEASQVRPADAMPTIARGKRLVVAGDERQLPPTSFFLTAAPEEEEEEIEAPVLAATEGFESILEALGMLLPFRMLGWHYRSHDERLIAFSNANFYDQSLTTFPGIGGPVPLRHVLVPFQGGQVGQEESVSDEVARVVELILEHAETRPGEPLGVIAMGIKHANRIEEVLFRELRERPELDEFFEEAHEERFFVKNLERVQGDERDAIILSIGYGKTPDGRMLYRFGPINYEGGERRLNVAVTRARKRLTLVSSFGSQDMDLERLKSEGAKLLRAYLQYAESEGANLGEQALEKPQLNAFEIDVRDTLTGAGIPLVAQLGASGYWIDFGAKHPTKAGQFILAIECDGASFHSTPTARDRDRLRQEQLERLGWRFHRIWSGDWFQNKERAVERAVKAYEHAVQDADKDRSSIRTRSARENGHGRARHGQEVPASHLPTRSPRPRVPRGYSIVDYTDNELVALADWIESDTLLRTEEDVLELLMADLGFERRGKRIVERMADAIRQARRQRSA